MKDNLLLIALRLEDFEWGRKDLAEKDLRENLKKCEDGYSESQRLMVTLQKDACEKKQNDIKAKSKENFH